jgi:hypothetical protein
MFWWLLGYSSTASDPVLVSDAVKKIEKYKILDMDLKLSEIYNKKKDGNDLDNYPKKSYKKLQISQSRRARNKHLVFKPLYLSKNSYDNLADLDLDLDSGEFLVVE